MKRLEEERENVIRIVIRILYCFNRNFERLPLSRDFWLGGSFFFWGAVYVHQAKVILV